MRKKATKITIRNLTRRQIPRVHSIKRIIRRVLELEKSRNFGLSVTYVNDVQIRRLNLKYRGRDSSTDVLAFSIREGKHIQGEGRFLGDVIISLDAAKRQAKYFKTTAKKELELYLIHGILHLLGYGDRNIKKRQEELMGIFS